MNLVPESQKQRESLARVLDEADADGSGTFTVDEVTAIVEQVSERMLMDERAFETEQGQAMGFDKHMVLRLRGFFDELDTDDSAELTIEEVGKAVKKLGWAIKRSTILNFMQAADRDHNSQLTFIEFLKFMVRLKEFCRPN